MDRCRICNSDNVESRGRQVRCRNCGKYTAKDSKHLEHAPNIILFDIETMFEEARVWDEGEQYVSHHQIIKEFNLLAWSAKNLFDKTMLFDVQTPKEAKNRDDRRILRSAWDVLNKADIVIGHNAQAFDVPKIFTRFIIEGMSKPSPFKVLDTLLAARSVFKFGSNKLDDLCAYLGLPGKLKTSMSLWIKCLEGDQKSLSYMSEYNQADILRLEEVYVKLRSWMPKHPNLDLYIEDGKTRCPYCLWQIIEPNGFYRTQVTTYQSCRCQHCGAYFRLPKGIHKSNVRVMV